MRLSVNTGFAVNRYPEPEVWTEIVAESGIKHVQLTTDLLEIRLPEDLVNRQTRDILRACDNQGLSISTIFTGAFTRVNHMAHPDLEVRKWWTNYFKRLVDVAARLGANSVGSHPGILSAKDDQDRGIRKLRVNQNVEAWHQVAEHAKAAGLAQLLWEPMSISREQGETISSARLLQKKLSSGSAIPILMCLDVDHGDVSSTDPRDTDPYVWLEEFAHVAPVIHLKQTTANKGGHWPFTAAYNVEGRIDPQRVVDIIRSRGVFETEFVFEFSFREREPFDRMAPSALKESAQYWEPHIQKGIQEMMEK